MMTTDQTLRAQAAAIENYANLMQSKGLAARAAWARNEARKVLAKAAATEMQTFAVAA